MKKISLLAIALMASLLFMCSDDNKIQPVSTVVLDPSSGSGKPGEVVNINVAFTAPNGGKELHVFVNGLEEDVVPLSGVTSPMAYEFTVPEDALVGDIIALGFQVLDNQNFNSAIANFMVSVGETLEGAMQTRTLEADQQYILRGQVFIPAGVTLTIPAGTIIKGDKATKAVLVVQPGGKLESLGDANNPVVFTSALPVGARDRGDWGGIVLLGNAYVNQPSKPPIEGINPSQTYGSTLAEAATPATNATENSGTIRYTRIEYAGIELLPNSETNGLTMGGVGNGTTVEYVQVSFGGDDGFEWFGGTVNAKYLVSHSVWDDDFDTDFGWGGNVQFGLVVRNTFMADQSGSNAFESDNQGNANTIAGHCDASVFTGCTRGVFSNITVLGPRDFTTSFTVTGLAARPISGNFQNAMHIRRRSALSIFNSFFAGYPVGFRLDDQSTMDHLNAGTSRLAYNLLASPNNTVLGASTTATNVAFATGLGTNPNTTETTALQTYWTANVNAVVNSSGGAPWSPTPGTPANSVDPYPGLGLNQNMFWGGASASTYPSNPSFVIGAGTIATGADFTDPKLPAAFFTTVAYRGAFGATDWTDGWAEFQPLNKVY